MPLGIPHSKFLRWSELDQDKALAWAAAQREICVCGTRRSEWERNPNAYVGFIDQCPGCELIELERDNVPEGTKGAKVGLIPLAVALADLDSLGNNDPPRPAPEDPGL